MVQTQAQTDESNKVSTPMQFWGWGVPANPSAGFDTPHIVVTTSKKCPIPLKGIRCLWDIKGNWTIKPISVADPLMPTSGDVCCHMNERHVWIVDVKLI